MASEIKESYENYLKAIYQISKKNRGGWCSNSEIADFLNVKPSSVTSMLYNLSGNGLIDWSPRKSLRLTEIGKKIAQSTLSIYAILKDFFANVLKIDDSSLVKKLSCGIEHHITPEVSEAFVNLLEFY